MAHVVLREDVTDEELVNALSNPRNLVDVTALADLSRLPTIIQATLHSNLSDFCADHIEHAQDLQFGYDTAKISLRGLRTFGKIHASVTAPESLDLDSALTGDAITCRELTGTLSLPALESINAINALKVEELIAPKLQLIGEAFLISDRAKVCIPETTEIPDACSVINYGVTDKPAPMPRVH